MQNTNPATVKHRLFSTGRTLDEEHGRSPDEVADIKRTRDLISARALDIALENQETSWACVKRAMAKAAEIEAIAKAEGAEVELIAHVRAIIEEALQRAWREQAKSEILFGGSGSSDDG